MRRPLVIYDCNRSRLNFLIYEENYFLFYQCTLYEHSIAGPAVPYIVHLTPLFLTLSPTLHKEGMYYCISFTFVSLCPPPSLSFCSLYYSQFFFFSLFLLLLSTVCTYNCLSFSLLFFFFTFSPCFVCPYSFDILWLLSNHFSPSSLSSVSLNLYTISTFPSSFVLPFLFLNLLSS